MCWHCFKHVSQEDRERLAFLAKEHKYSALHAKQDQLIQRVRLIRGPDVR